MELFQNAAEKLKKEYQVFLDHLDLNEVQLSERTEHIGKKDCFALNSQFNIVCEKYLTSGRTQDYYTVIDFFYFFSVRTDILQIVKVKGKGLTVQKSQRYYVFSQMSVMEQYIFMMAVWLGEYQHVLNDRHLLYRGLLASMKEAKAGASLSDPYEGRVTAPWGSYYFPEIRLFALFQLITIEWLEETIEDKENKFRIKELYLTSEGYFWRKLYEKQKKPFWYILDVDSILPVIMEITEEATDDMEMKLMHFWANPVEAGLHTIMLKVVVGSCIRRIKIGDQFTLDDLHYLIQESVAFDMDHLYFFQIGSGTSMKRYFAPECEDEPWAADTIPLAELSLYEGMRFEYLFDFGDKWRFQITVEQILPEHTQEWEVSRVKGEAPEQYEYGW